MKIGVSMNEYKKIEWIHNQLSELINNNEIPIDELKTMQLFIEQIRENYFNKNGNLKNKWR
jgi:hypothetical protein